MAQIMLPRLRSQMRLSGLGGTPDLLSCCRGSRTRAAVCLLARPSRSIQISSGSSLMIDQAAAGYDQTTRSSSGSNSEAVQEGLRAHQTSTPSEHPPITVTVITRRATRAPDIDPIRAPPHYYHSVMKAGKLIDNLSGIINDRCPILYTITARLPGADRKILLYLGQSRDGLKRMLSYYQQGEGCFGDKDDSEKKDCPLMLAAMGATIEVQFVEVPAPLTPEDLKKLVKDILKKVDFPLNSNNNGQEGVFQLLAQFDRPNPVRTEYSGQEATKVMKMCQKLIARLQPVSLGLQNSGSPLVIAMSDSRVSPATIFQYKKYELQEVYYNLTGRVPPKMSKKELTQVVLDLSSGVAASSNNDAGFPDPINTDQDRRVSETPCSNDVLLTAPTDSHPSRSTSSMASAASVDSNTVSPTTGRRCRRASKAGGSSAVVAISVSSSSDSQQQLTGSNNATSAGGEGLSELLTPVLQGLVRVLCGPDAARSQKYLTHEECLVLLKGKLPKRDTEASLAAVAKDSFLNKITPDFLMTAAATRSILDACYYFSEGRVLTSKDMKIKQLRDLLLRRIEAKPSVLNFPLTEVVPSTPECIKPSICRRPSNKKAAIIGKQLVPKRRRR